MSYAGESSRAALLAASLLVAGLSVSAFASQRLRPHASAAPSASARSEVKGGNRLTQARALREGRPLDVNMATAEDLRLLPGIGPQLASRIVSHREQVGRFTRLADLDAVPGIGPKTLQRIAPMLTLTREDAGASERQQPAR